MGWRPAEFWAATWWDLTAAIAAWNAMHAPPEPKPFTAENVSAVFRGLKAGKS